MKGGRISEGDKYIYVVSVVLFIYKYHRTFLVFDKLQEQDVLKYILHHPYIYLLELFLEPAVPAGHVPRSLPLEVQGPHPPGDVHHAGGQRDHPVPASLPQGGEERDRRPRLLHVQPFHPFRLGGVRRPVLSQVRVFLMYVLRLNFRDSCLYIINNIELLYYHCCLLLAVETINLVLLGCPPMTRMRVRRCTTSRRPTSASSASPAQRSPSSLSSRVANILFLWLKIETTNQNLVPYTYYKKHIYICSFFLQYKLRNTVWQP